jgi:hypothetical protein
MLKFRAQLEEAVGKLEDHYDELRAAARRRLGELYCPHDYPPSLKGWFAVDWDFPSVEPPGYLLQLHPDIYEQEKNRVAQRFQEAVQLAEQAFLDEFARLVAHLTERLGEGADGQPKVFRDSAITRLVEFFGRFRELNVRSSEDLEELVSRTQRIVRGVAPQALRDNDSLRQSIARQLGQVQAAMEPMMMEVPRRRIIRSVSASGGNHAVDH